MPEEEVKGGAEGSEEGKKKSGLIKLIIIGVGGLLVLGGGGFAAYKFFFAPKSAVEGSAEAGHGEKKEEKKEEHKSEGHGKEEKAPPVFKFEPIVANLADPGGRRYIRLTLSLDIKDESLKKQIESHMPEIRDSVILLLSSKTSADLIPVAGKLKLRIEILKIINSSLGGTGQVNSLLYDDIVIQ